MVEGSCCWMDDKHWGFVCCSTLVFSFGCSVFFPWCIRTGKSHSAVQAEFGEDLGEQRVEHQWMLVWTSLVCGEVAVCEGHKVFKLMMLFQMWLVLIWEVQILCFLQNPLLLCEFFIFQVIDSSDVVVQVLDARDPIGTRSPHVESYLKKEKHWKHLIFVLNKCDLVPTWATVSTVLPIILWTFFVPVIAVL